MLAIFLFILTVFFRKKLMHVITVFFRCMSYAGGLVISHAVLLGKALGATNNTTSKTVCNKNHLFKKLDLKNCIL